MVSPRAGKADKDIGQRMRLRRIEIKMSQQALAPSLGVTFQQIQKYEMGINRVNAPRLQQIATALGVNVTFFYDGSTASEKQQEVESLLSPDAQFSLRLLRAYKSIESPQLRRSFVTLAETLADNGV
jgi:transcriptional regulator with XRE-family HTH domain